MGLKKDEENMKNHLRDYILFQISQGYEADDVKKLLLNYGYKKKLVEGIFMEIGSLPVQRPAKKSRQKLSDDLTGYLKELLTDFIIKEKEQGYTTNAIRRALINYGHNRELVDSAIEAVEGSGGKDFRQGKEFFTSDDFSFKKKKKKTGLKRSEVNLSRLKKGFPPHVLYIFSIVFIIAFSVFLSASTNTYIYIVVLSFMPAIIALTVNFFGLLQFKSSSYMNLVPFLVVFLTAFIFIGILELDTPLREIAQPETVFLLNVLMSFLFSSMLCFFSNWPHLGEKAKPWDKIPNNKDENETPLEKEFDKEEKRLEKIIGSGEKEK
ncbi:MAG: hypothetical protein ACOCQG_02025 [Candidatus Nanoarchaeia archaeon]